MSLNKNQGLQTDEYDPNGHKKHHMGYLYPELYPPAKIPSMYPVPSHII